ncbi:hypothetical protein [Streptomyces tunisiensis]|uniref:hypothetical protein n=1 Tax=Streptomyces tunisiensis TaxID=948699 RepID=UPI003EE30456
MPSWLTARTHPARSAITSGGAESALSSHSRPTRSATGRGGGRPPAFDAETYKQRNAVERCINRLKQWRGLAMRTDKLAIAYQAALHLAAILIWTVA